MKSILKSAGLASFSLVAFSVMAPVNASDVADPAECTVMGIVQGGGDMSFSNNSGLYPASNWSTGYGEAALDYSCGNWTGQADAAYYSNWASKGSPTSYMSDAEGHIGGAVFWRDSDLAEIGFSLSRTFQSDHAERSGAPLVPSSSGGLWRVGTFAEYYGGDTFTLGAGANYIDGDIANYNFAMHQKGFEGDVYAKIYASDNIGFTVRGDFLSSNLESTGIFVTELNGYAVSSEVEYLVADTALSVFANVRYAMRTTNFGSNEKYEDTQASFGLRYEFGESVPSSLRARDRHGSFDNTSVFDEKLPSLNSEYLNYSLAP